MKIIFVKTHLSIFLPFPSFSLLFPSFPSFPITMNARAFLTTPASWRDQVERRDIGDAFDFLCQMYEGITRWNATYIAATTHFITHCGDMVDAQDYLTALGWGFGEQPRSHGLRDMVAAFRFIKRRVPLLPWDIAQTVEHFMNREDFDLRPYTTATLALKRASLTRPEHHSEIAWWIRAYTRERTWLPVVRKFARDLRARN